MATEIMSGLFNINICTICRTRVHLSNKKVRCSLCCNYVHRGCIGYDDGTFYCSSCLLGSLPFLNCDDSDFFNLAGRSPLNVLTMNINLKLNLNFHESLDSKFVNNDGIDADDYHFNYLLGNIFGYSDSDQVNTILPKNESVNLGSMMHLNARSLLANQDLLYCNLQTLDHKFSILAITETWSSDLNENAINIPGYSNNIKSRRSGRGGD